MRPRFAFACLIPALVLGLGLGCSDDSKDPASPDPDPYLAPTPEDVLTNFVTSLVEMDIDACEATLAEEFEFRSTEPGYESLTKTEVVTIVTNMFAEVLGIEIRLDHAGAVPSTVEGFPSDDAYMMIAIPAARLRIETTRDQGQGPITYLVDGDVSVFVFEETSPDSWQMVMHEAEGPSDRAAIEQWTWPEVMELFRSPARPAALVR